MEILVCDGDDGDLYIMEPTSVLHPAFIHLCGHHRQKGLSYWGTSPVLPNQITIHGLRVSL